MPSGVSNIFTLYRFFDVTDRLLYVGLTINPGRRMEKHRDNKSWWTDVARIEMEQHHDIQALRAAERAAIHTEKPLHNIRMNGSSGRRPTPSGEAPTEIDGLVGRFFHSWRPKREGDQHVTIRNGRVLEWQGHIIEEVGDELYLIELFSWWDGCPNGQQLARVDDMAMWTFYDSGLEMQMGLGCPEADPDRCGNEVTHYFDNRKYGLGLQLLCYGCVRRYPGFKNALEFQWQDGKPVLP